MKYFKDSFVSNNHHSDTPSMSMGVSVKNW